MINDNCQNPCRTCRPAPPGAEGFGLSPVNPDYPFVNLSAELPDIDLFIAVVPDPFGEPPLGSTWYAVGCLGFCFSNISQEDADLCAARQAAECVSGNWPVDIPNPILPTPENPDEPPFIPVNRPLFGNTVQTCDFTCPDGSLFTYTVAAGTFTAFNLATANAWAYSFACLKAAQDYICIGSLPTTGLCIGSQYGLVISISASNKPVTASISAGALPDGITMTMGANPLVPTVILSGTTTSVGAYSFTLLVTDSFGNTSTKSYSLSVAGIVDSGQLTDADLGVPYLFTLTTGGEFAGPLVFSVLSGELPDGLSLQPLSGEIIGTPTVAAFFEFTILVTDGVVSCSKDLSMNVADVVAAPDWSLIPWSNYVELEVGGATISVTPTSPSASWVATGDQGAGFATATNNNNDFTYNGPATNCQLDVNCGTNPADFSWGITVEIVETATTILSKLESDLVVGANNFQFVVPDTGGGDRTIRVSIGCGTGFGIFNISGVFSNV